MHPSTGTLLLCTGGGGGGGRPAWLPCGLLGISSEEGYEGSGSWVYPTRRLIAMAFVGGFTRRTKYPIAPLSSEHCKTPMPAAILGWSNCQLSPAAQSISPSLVAKWSCFKLGDIQD